MGTHLQVPTKAIMVNKAKMPPQAPHSHHTMASRARIKLRNNRTTVHQGHLLVYRPTQVGLPRNSLKESQTSLQSSLVLCRIQFRT